MSTRFDGAEVVVRGIVVPVSWDGVGNPLRVAILTSDEGEYQVAPSGLGRRLFSFLRQEIKARVLVPADDDGRPVKLVSFTLVNRRIFDEPVAELPPPDGIPSGGDGMDAGSGGLHDG